MLIAAYVSGVTQINVWTNSKPDVIRERFRSQPFESPLHLQQEMLPESSEERTGCGGIATKISVEMPSYKLANADSLITWSKKSGFEICDGPAFSHNQTPHSSSRITHQLNGLPWLLLLTLSFCVVLAIYRYQGFEQRSDFRVTMSYRQRIAIAIIAAGLIFAIRIATFGWNTVDASFPYAIAVEDSSLTLPILLSLGVMIPLIEETSFRAWLIPMAIRSIGKVGGLAFSVAMFAAVHWVFDLPSLLFYIGAGAILSLLWLWTRSLLACVLAHGSYNVAIALIG